MITLEEKEAVARFRAVLAADPRNALTMAAAMLVAAAEAVAVGDGENPKRGYDITGLGSGGRTITISAAKK